MIGWDDHAVHGNIFTIMRQRGPQFDQSVSALIEDLEQRGMRDEVLVVVAGEFGRTPRVHVHKGCPGREHWGPAGCALVYGGGFAMGQVVGSTNSLGETPQDRPVTYQDLLATIYESLGIPLSQTFVNETGRPVPLLPAGQPIAELTSGTRRTAANDDRRPSQPLNRELPHNPDFAVVLPRNTTADDIRRRSDRGQWLSLAMQETRVDDRALESLSDCRTLRRLSLNGLPITDAGLVHLSTLSTLEELVLTGTQVTDAGLASLRSLRNLRRLAINGTGISIGGIVELFVSHQQRTLIDALAALHLVTFDEHHSPVAIDVAGTSFSDAELRHLNAVPSLRELHLAATRVTDQGLTATGSLDNLERLFLAKCDITDAGLASISRFPRLQALNLVGTKITSAGLAHLAELRDLRSLLITDLKLSPAAVEQLKGRLPQLTVSDFTPV
jgi:Leucine-rich repeat (LRR) protein